MYTNNAAELQNSPHDLEMLGKTLERVFDKKGGRSLIFTSVHKIQTNQLAKYESKDKTNTLKPKVKNFAELGEKLSLKSVSIDLFITSEFEMELATISQLSIKTSGNVYFYPDFKIQNYSDNIYYDLFRNLTI